MKSICKGYCFILFPGVTAGVIL